MNQESHFDNKEIDIDLFPQNIPNCKGLGKTFLDIQNYLLTFLTNPKAEKTLPNLFHGYESIYLAQVYRHTLLYPKTPVMRLAEKERRPRSFHPFIRGGTTLVPSNESNECVIATTNKSRCASWKSSGFPRAVLPFLYEIFMRLEQFVWNLVYFVQAKELKFASNVSGRTQKKDDNNTHVHIIIMDCK